MDVIALLDDQWASHKPVTPKIQPSPSLILKPVSPPPEQTQPRIQHSLSDGNYPIVAPPIAAREDAQKLREYLSAPNEALPSVPELPTVPLSCPEQNAGDVPLLHEPSVEEPQAEIPASPALTKQSYGKGLGPAPPLVTAVILLLMPMWLPVLAFFFLPLAFTWALIAGVSLVTTGFLNVISRWWGYLESFLRQSALAVQSSNTQ